MGALRQPYAAGVGPRMALDFRLVSFPAEWLLCPATARRYAGQVVTMPASMFRPETIRRAVAWMREHQG